MVAHDEPKRFELALLKSRALLRLRRAEEALSTLRACAFTATSTDGIVTAQMLVGAAHVLLGEHERAATALTDAAKHAPGAHPTIQCELALTRGIALYTTARYDEADALLAEVSADADIVYARALEYRGWVAYTRGRLKLAAERFGEAFRRLDECRWRDRFVEANILQGLSTVQAETLQTEGWDLVEARIRRFDWTTEGLGRPRFWIAITCSTMREVLGDEEGARAWVRRAEMSAPSATYLVVAYCRMAELFGNFGERRAQSEFAGRAREVYESIDKQTVAEDAAQLPLDVAQELVWSTPDDAERLLGIHCARSTTRSVPTFSGQMYEAIEHDVRGRIAEVRGERNTAVREYTKALRLTRATDHHRQGSALAIRLARLTGARRYVEYAEKALRHVSPKYWLVKKLGELQRKESTPSLTDNQRLVLRLVAQGKTYKEIGQSLGRSWKTVNNNVEQLRAKFGVRTRGELVAAAARLNIVELHQPRTSRSA